MTFDDEFLWVPQHRCLRCLGTPQWSWDPLAAANLWCWTAWQRCIEKCPNFKAVFLLKSHQPPKNVLSLVRYLGTISVIYIYIQKIMFCHDFFGFGLYCSIIFFSGARRRRRHWTCQPLCCPWTQRPSPPRSLAAGAPGGCGCPPKKRGLWSLNLNAGIEGRSGRDSVLKKGSRSLNLKL